jgi:tetratricopeptide (TPR) repeat protein
MNRRVGTLLLVIVVVANAAAVWLYSGDGPVGPSRMAGAGGWNPILDGIAAALTLPIHSAEIAEVRDVVLPVAFGLALLAITVGFFVRSTDNAELTATADGVREGPRRALRNPAERWLWATSAAILVIAILSALANQRFDLAWGWIFRFAVGAGWAVLIVRIFSVGMVKRTVTGLMIVALITLVLTLVHRADRHLAYFHWPIGPITPTAAFAALWAAMAFVLVVLHVLHRRVRFSTILFAMTCAVAVYALQQTGRRGPVLGLAGAGLLTTLILLRSRFRGQAMALAMFVMVGIAAVGAGWYVVSQLKSAEPEASGALALRFELWRLAWGLIADHPSLGVGPDTFFIEMTNAVAPLRAVSPHVYHGNVNLYAHNEWIQSAVELGIPGALFYLALPVGIIIMAWRGFHAPQTSPSASASNNGLQIEALQRERRSAMIVLIAALAAIVLIDSSGITLRAPMMPVWYWTLIGLLTALCGNRALQSSPAPLRVPKPIKAIVATALAAVCFAVSYGDMSLALVPTDPFKRLSLGDRPRLYAEKTVNERQQAAVYMSALAKAEPDEAHLQEAVERWARLFALIPAFRDTPARYARALLAIGREKDAKEVLKKAIGLGLDCYEPAANAMFAKFRGDDPPGQLRCVQRALRNSALSDALKTILTDIGDKPFLRVTLREELPLARSMAQARKPPGRTMMIVEVLRANAFLRFHEGNTKEAISDQRLIAEYYAFLEKTNSPYRRGHDAEVDAFFTLARMLYEADHADFAEACDAIRTAERYAVLGISHETLANPQPEYGYVIGEVVPTEFPPRLRPLWKFSALLHLLAGDDRFLDYRIYFSLPPEQWNEAALNRELSDLARLAYEVLTDVPADKRPDHYDKLPAMVQRHQRPGALKSES